MGIIAVGCGAVSILFCLLLEYVSKGYDKWLKNPYLRVFAAGCLVVVLYWILGTDRYMGAGNQLIEQAVEHGQTQVFEGGRLFLHLPLVPPLAAWQDRSWDSPRR